MNANELADKVIEVLGEFWLSTQCATMLRQQQAKIAEQERTIKGNRIHIRQLELVTYWLKENRPEVWEDIQKWRKYEPKR